MVSGSKLALLAGLTCLGTRAHISSRLSELSTFAVQIDGSPLLRKNGTGVYDTPILNDGEHTVVYAVGNASLFPAFDYATVTAGPSTNLNGKNIIVDDTDNSLEYSGNWAVLPPDTLLVLDPSSAPYKDTTHWASTVGDSVKLTFEGESTRILWLVWIRSDSLLGFRNINFRLPDDSSLDAFGGWRCWQYHCHILSWQQHSRQYFIPNDK